MKTVETWDSGETVSVQDGGEERRCGVSQMEIDFETGRLRPQRILPPTPHLVIRWKAGEDVPRVYVSTPGGIKLLPKATRWPGLKQEAVAMPPVQTVRVRGSVREVTTPPFVWEEKSGQP